jgi:hypothetical protein
MRTVGDVQVLVGRLKHSGPDFVYQWFEDRAKNSESSEEIEQALLARRDPLINLALARYGSSSEIVKALFQSGDDDICIAALSNQTGKSWFSSGNLSSILFESERDLSSFLSSQDDTQIYVFLANPAIDHDFLTRLYKRSDFFAQLSDDRWHRLIGAASVNPRLGLQYSGPIDGWAEYRHNELCKAVWTLADRVPTTANWATTLFLTLERTRQDSSVFENWDYILQRWRINEEIDYSDLGYLAGYGLVRMALARGAGLSTGCLHDDIAVRCHAYRSADLSLDQMERAFEKEPKFFFNYAVDNPAVWKNPDLRTALSKMAWEFGEQTLDFVNSFNNTADRMQRKYPDWFSDDQAQEAEIESRKRQDDVLTEMNRQILALNAKVDAFTSTNRLLVVALIAIALLLLWHSL